MNERNKLIKRQRAKLAGFILLVDWSSDTPLYTQSKWANSACAHPWRTGNNLTFTFQRLTEEGQEEEPRTLKREKDTGMAFCPVSGEVHFLHPHPSGKEFLPLGWEPLSHAMGSGTIPDSLLFTSNALQNDESQGWGPDPAACTVCLDFLVMLFSLAIIIKC